MADRSININRQQQQKIRNAVANYQSKSGNSIQFIEMGGNVPFTLSSPTPSPTPTVTMTSTPTATPSPTPTPSFSVTPSVTP